jgi:glutathione S-transferase
MLRIWGRNNSSNVQKVVWAADEVKVPFERIDAGGAFGKTKEPKYLAMNPNALVPTIEDGGLVLWESNTIVRYLAAKYGKGSLWIEDPGKRASAEKWQDWGFTLGVSNGPLFWGYVRTPPDKRDPAALEAARVKAIETWQIVDNQLKNQPWIAGPDFSIGDIGLGVFVHRWHQFPIDRGRLPNVEAYYERLKARPAYAKHVVGVPLT